MNSTLYKQIPHCVRNDLSQAFTITQLISRNIKQWKGKTSNDETFAKAITMLGSILLDM